MTPELVAYRGLWDRFARPDSPEALRRAYLRGVPSLVHAAADEARLAEAARVVADPTVNRRRLPAYFVTDDFLQTASALRRMPEWMDVFVVVRRAAGAPTCPVWQRLAGEWVRAGAYVSHEAACAGSAELNPSSAAGVRPFVLVEAANVLNTRPARPGSTDGGEQAVGKLVEALLSTSVALIRVSDFVELDQLNRIRGAA